MKGTYLGPHFGNETIKAYLEQIQARFHTLDDGALFERLAELLDACVRLLPGVMGADESLAEESFESGLLEYPHYTRPQSWCGRAVPETLISGHHANIAAWRRAEAERITRERRPDLWARYAKSH